MRAIAMLARSELRRRWRSVVVLTALVAGARRTDTSLQRFEDASRSASVEFDIGEATREQVAQFERTPNVTAVAEVRQFPLVKDSQFLSVAGQIDRRFGTVVDRARLIDGRFADQDRVDEINVSE